MKETLEEKEQRIIDETKMLCFLIEGKLATSTPEFIDSNIARIKNLKTLANDSVLSRSLVKRLTNIKTELLQEKKGQA